MRYSALLKASIKQKRMTLGEIEEMLKDDGLKTNKAYISKLQNGKLPPPGDKLNDALAMVLGIDPIELKAAAYCDKIPANVLERIKTIA